MILKVTASGEVQDPIDHIPGRLIKWTKLHQAMCIYNDILQGGYDFIVVSLLVC